MKKYFLISLTLIMSMVFVACGGSSQPSGDTEATKAVTQAVTEASETPGETTGAVNPAEISEKAMDNFLNKLTEGNYVMTSGDFVKATVFSKDQLYFDYEEGYNDIAIVSVDGEVFQGILDGSDLSDVEFVGEGTAIEAADSKLLTYWLRDEVSEGNIYNLFYNDTEDPLKFVSYDETVKRTLNSFAGYSELALARTKDVYLTFDQEDPTEAHIEAEVEDDISGRHYYDDIDILITFGNAQSNSACDSWMSSPVYPAAKTAWNEIDEFEFNSVFMPGYGLEAIPFPVFASYALKVDEDFMTNSEINIRDSHATESDMAAYVNTLRDNGFTDVTVTEEDGTQKTYFRKLLREEQKCYSSIYLEYDDGLNINAKKYYEFPEYEGLDEINALITPFGYTALPDSPNFVSVKGTDTAYEQTESWLYLFDYNIVLYVDIDFTDYDEMMSYLDDYANTLTAAGFMPQYVPDTEEIDMYVSPDGASNYRYHVEDEDTITLLYKSEKFIPVDEAEAIIKDAGFPEVDLTDNAECKDLRKFSEVQFGRAYSTYITASMVFDKIEDAEQFFNDYEEKLTDADFGRVNPENVGTNKQVALYNEDTRMLVAVDFIPGETGAVINYEFKIE